MKISRVQNHTTKFKRIVLCAMSSLPAPSAPPVTQEINLISSEDEDASVTTQTAIPAKKPRGRPRKLDRQQERLQGPLAPVPVENKNTLSAKLKQSLEEMKDKAAALETKQTTIQKTLDETLEAIKCVVCYSTMYRPTTLSCGHSACSLCLTLHKQISANKPNCPVCRAVHTGSYKVNITLQNIIQVQLYFSFDVMNAYTGRYILECHWSWGLQPKWSGSSQWSTRCYEAQSTDSRLV